MMPVTVQHILELLLWLTVACYAGATVFFVFYSSFDQKKLDRAGWILTICGLFIHAIAILLRWNLVGHGPYRTIHEILVCDSAFIVGAFVLVGLQVERLRASGVIVLPLTLIMMGLGLLAPQAGAYLSPSLKSPWLAVHVLFAKMTVGCIVVATGMATGLLLRKIKSGRIARLIGLFPDNQSIVDLCQKLFQVAFVFASLMIIAGAIWANDAWGRYWGWDPIEIWSLIVWALYAFILHVRLSWRLNDSVYAWLVVAAFVVSIVAFFLVPFGAESIHSQYFA